MKIARSIDNRPLGQALRREAQILKMLEGVSAPLLFAEGEFEKRPYLVMSWIEGRTAAQVADELRQRGEFGQLLSLCMAILRAYAALHAKDVRHSDVHPRKRNRTGRQRDIYYRFRSGGFWFDRQAKAPTHSAWRGCNVFRAGIRHGAIGQTSSPRCNVCERTIRTG